MADPMRGERRVRNQRKLVTALWLVVSTVAGCTKVRQQTDPLPARPLPPIAHSNEPTRRPWPTTPTAVTQPPDAAPTVIVDTLNGDPKGLKREDINNAFRAHFPHSPAVFRAPGDHLRSA